MGQGASEVTGAGSTDEVSQDPEVERLVEDIEETRDEMTGTVEEIGDRLDPKNIVADAKETVRAATVGKVEEMANTAGEVASDATETVREAGSSVVEMITRNPVPAAMVGIGLGWLVMASRNESSRNQDYRMAYPRQAYRGQAYRGQDYSGQGYSDEGYSGQSSSGPDTIDQAKQRMTQLADDVPNQVRSTASEVGDQATQLYNSNPLAVGAVAVAVGTAIGLALPVTDVERRTMAEPARKALSRAEDVATDALGDVEEQARSAEEQALEEERQARPH